MSTEQAFIPDTERTAPPPVDREGRLGDRAGTPWWAPAGVALLAALAVLEIGLDFFQRSRVPTRADWEAAARAVRREHRPGDLIVTAPDWADPLGRLVLGDLMTLDDVSRPDASTYPTIFELSLRGARHPDTAGARQVWRRSFGRITATRYAQSVVPVATDFYQALPDARVWETRAGRPSPPCTWDARRVRFQCGAGWKSVRAIRAEVGFAARRCIAAHPIDGATRVIEYRDVDPGVRVVVYTGFAGYDPRYRARRAVWEYGQWRSGRLRRERPLRPIAAAPVVLAVTVDGRPLGRIAHAIHDESFRRTVLAVPGARASGTSPTTARSTVRFEVSTRHAWSKNYCFYARAERRGP